MEVSPDGTGPVAGRPQHERPRRLAAILVNLQNQTLELQRQILELQRQQLELPREAAQVSREQRARQIAELERWQTGHEYVLETAASRSANLEQVHAALMGELADYVEENHENLLDGDFALTDFVDRFGPRLAHLNTMLAVLRPLRRRPNPEGRGLKPDAAQTPRLSRSGRVIALAGRTRRSGRRSRIGSWPHVLRPDEAGSCVTASVLALRSG